MDNGVAGSGALAPQANGVVTTGRRMPAACPVAPKQKPSKTLQPANKLPKRKQPSATATGPPTALCGTSRMLGDETAKKSNMQPKQAAPKGSSATTLSARIAVKKGMGGQPNRLKTSEKMAPEKEVQQNPTKVTTQSLASGASKTASTKSRKTEQSKPSRTWLPGSKNSTSSSFNRVATNEKSVCKPTAPSAGQAAPVQQQKNILAGQKDASRVATVPKAKVSSSNTSGKMPPVPKYTKLFSSKSQSEQNPGERNGAAPVNSRFPAKKFSNSSKPQSPAKAADGNIYPATPRKVFVSSPKLPNTGESPGKKLLKKDTFSKPERITTQKKLQKTLAKEGICKETTGETESTPIKDAELLEKLESTTEGKTVDQLPLQETVSCCVKVIGMEKMELKGSEEGSTAEPSNTDVAKVLPPVSLEAPLVCPGPPNVNISSANEMPHLAALEGLEQHGDGAETQVAFPCKTSSPISLEFSLQIPPAESLCHGVGGTDSEYLRNQASHFDASEVLEQPYLLQTTGKPCVDIHHFLMTSLPAEDSQISIKETIPLLERSSSPDSLTLEAQLLEEPQTIKTLVLEETQQESTSSREKSLLDSQVDRTLKTVSESEGTGNDGRNRVEVVNGILDLYQCPEEEVQKEVVSLEVGNERMGSPLGLSTEDSELTHQADTYQQIESKNHSAIHAEDGEQVEVLQVAEHLIIGKAQDQIPLLQLVAATSILTESTGKLSAGHDDQSNSLDDYPTIGDLEDEALIPEECMSIMKQEEASQAEAPDILLHPSGEISPSGGTAQLSIYKPQSLPLKSLELLQEHPTQLAEVPELLLSTGLKGFSPEKGGSSSKSSTLSGPDLAGKSSSETSTPEELREYDSSSGIESKSDEKLEQTCHQLLSPLEDLPGEIDLGIHMEKGDDEAETLPADEVLGDPPTEPTVSSEEEAELDADLLKETGFPKTGCLLTSPPTTKPPLPHSVEESDEPGSGDAGTETPASTNSAASCDVFGAFHLHSTDSCGKSPGVSSLESEEHSTEGSKELLKETSSRILMDWEQPLHISPGPLKIGGEEEESPQLFTGTHNLATGDNGAGLPFPWGPCPSENLSTIYEVESGAETPGPDEEDRSHCLRAISREQALHLGNIQATVVQQLISRALLFPAEAPLRAVNRKGAMNSEEEIGKWTELISPLDESRASITSVTCFSPEDMSSPNGDWTVVEVETFH